MSKKLADNINTQFSGVDETSSYSKGKELELEFASFMKRSLGFEETANRRDVSSAQNGSGTNVDVIGFKTDPRGREYKNYGVILIAFSLLGIIFKAFYTLENQMNDATLSTQIFLFLIIILSLGCFLMYRSKALESKNAWVECKNLKGKATYNQLTIMFEQYKNYQNSNNGKYKFTELYFVSANGFVDNALVYAKQKNIKCFIKDTNDKFIEV